MEASFADFTSRDARYHADGPDTASPPFDADAEAEGGDAVAVKLGRFERAGDHDCATRFVSLEHDLDSALMGQAGHAFEQCPNHIVHIVVFVVVQNDRIRWQNVLPCSRFAFGLRGKNSAGVHRYVAPSGLGLQRGLILSHMARIRFLSYISSLLLTDDFHLIAYLECHQVLANLKSTRVGFLCALY